MPTTWKLLLLFLLTAFPAVAQQALPPVGPPTGMACAYNTTNPSLPAGSAGWVQCNSAGALVTAPATGALPATIFSIQQTATASAMALPSQPMVNGAVCIALTTNTGTISIGPAAETAATGYPLKPGQAISYAVANLSALYILDATITDAIACTGN